MATCDILPGAVKVLRLGLLFFCVNTFNAEMYPQWSGGTTRTL